MKTCRLIPGGWGRVDRDCTNDDTKSVIKNYICCPATHLLSSWDDTGVLSTLWQDPPDVDVPLAFRPTATRPGRSGSIDWTTGVHALAKSW